MVMNLQARHIVKDALIYLEGISTCTDRTEIDPVLYAFISPCQALRSLVAKFCSFVKICNDLLVAVLQDLISCQRLLQSVICYKRPSFGLHNSSLQGTTMQR